MTKINVFIPKPCHEDWHAMTPEGQGRFCNSCQKNVFDFTKSSDREIVTAFEQNQNLCGRFLNTQLNRDLIKPEKKNPVWLATASALISFVGLGTHEAIAQVTAKTVQTDRKLVGKPAMPKKEIDSVLVAGVVVDENKTPMPNLGIYNKGRKIGETNENGNFSIKVPLYTRLVFRHDEDEDDYATELRVKDNCSSNIEINYVKYATVKKIYVTMCGLTGMKAEPIKRTFFGRIFHWVGNLFRKN